MCDLKSYNGGCVGVAVICPCDMCSRMVSPIIMCLRLEEGALMECKWRCAALHNK